ncbi:hypothetical protein SADUNF_Sadunf04G0064400 [Salix dunnii]|uniref:Uncharacterized protein n=1 Tax=Salix dunnii TaxID=1413687 RepID=A0A835KAY9_9ROSI|nr:hypothetical protein SADUNF_Sadunf04G0064400 [Salix dunnii]
MEETNVFNGWISRVGYGSSSWLLSGFSKARHLQMRVAELGRGICKETPKTVVALWYLAWLDLHFVLSEFWFVRVLGERDGDRGRPNASESEAVLSTSASDKADEGEDLWPDSQNRIEAEERSLPRGEKIQKRKSSQ